MKTIIRKQSVRLLALLLAAITLASAAWLVSSTAGTAASAASETVNYTGATPKYIFLFIGDGMSYPQVTATQDYLGKIENAGTVAYKETNGKDTPLVGEKRLPFTQFPILGSATTFDSTSLCPDSASTATAMSTGHKTRSSTINMDEEGKITYETITEKLKKQLGYKIGIVTSVSMDHATPAAFYAHQFSRSSYYEIGLELATSGFDYFGGGGFLQPTGKNKDQTSLTELFEKNGYTILDSNQAIKSFSDKNAKVIATNPILDGSMAMPYAIDKADTAKGLTLADYTQKGIDLLTNDTGFFMMIEGGKVDWACHANDAATTIADMIAFSDAVDVAIKFAAQHPDDTLILVTGDHETGGLTIGFAATGYSTYFEKVSEQTISYDNFDKEIAKLKSTIASFDEAMVLVKENFGLMLATDPDASKNPDMVLTEYETQRLKDAYRTVLHGTTASAYTEEQNVLYGTYNPFSVTVTHILNNKAGLAFTSYAHTGLPVPVYAKGVGSELFAGYYDDTDIFFNLQSITHVK